jgi:AsmA protein
MANNRSPRTQRIQKTDRWLAIAAYGGLGLGCLLLLVATFVLLAAPVDLVRDKLVQDVRARTGRNLVIAGPTSLVLFPRLGVSFGNVSLSAPPGMGGEPTVRIETLEAELSLLSFLSQHTGVERVVLTRPIFDLRIDSQGRRSWDLAAAAQRVRLAQAGSRNVPRGRGATQEEQLAALLDTVAPARVRINSGTVRYRDDRFRLGHEATGLDLDLDIERADGPLQVKGNITWLSEPLAFEGTLASVRAALLGQQSRVAGRLTGRPLQASYDGRLSLGPDGAFNGSLSVKAASMQTLIAWVAGPTTAGQGSGPLDLSASVRSSSSEISLSRLTATVGGSTLDGSLAIDTKSARPKVTGDLRVSELDFTRLVTNRAGAPVAPAPAKRLSDPAGEAPGGRDASSGSQQLQSPARRGRADGGWSDDNVDFILLGIADAELTLSADRIVHKELKIGPSRLAVRNDNKVAKLTLQDMQLYDGRGRGELTLDGSRQVPAVAASMAFEGVSTLPFLKDALGFDWLEGRSTIALSVTGQGSSERQIVETLNGKIDMVTANGAISGFDLDKMVRNLEEGRLDFATAPDEKTPFSEFAGSLTITNGVAQNRDLRVASPRLRINGEGTIDIGQRQLDYTVTPKIVGGAAAPGALVNIRNIEIPLRITGSWDQPNFGIRGQEQILDAIRNIKPKDVEDALKGLFGGNNDGQRVKPRDLIERLLKKQ